MVRFDSQDPREFIIGIIEQSLKNIPPSLPPPKRGGRINPDNTPDKENKYCKVCKKQTTINRCECHSNKDICYPEHLKNGHVSKFKK